MNARIVGDFKSGLVHETKVFMGIKEAVEYTKIPADRITRCIDTGGKWKAWTFDLA